jgi:Polysaccharide lyase
VSAFYRLCDPPESVTIAAVNSQTRHSVTYPALLLGDRRGGRFDRGALVLVLATLVFVMLVLTAGPGTALAGSSAAGSSAVEPPGLLWVGDGEAGGLSQFQDAPWNNVGGTAPRLVEDPVRDGRFAVGLGLAGATSAGDGICCGSRNELLPRFRDLVPGDDLYFGFSTYLASGFPTSGGWQVITQFKHNFDGSPPLSLNVEDGQFSIQGGYGHPSGPRHFVRSVGPAVTGQWSDWVLHVKFSPDPAVGFVEVWRDGELVLERFAPESGTMYPNPHGEVGSILKVGPYRESSIATPETIYFDNWRIGTSRKAVARPLPMPLWVGDGEAGDLSQFQDAPWNNVGGTAPRLVEDPVRDGRFAVGLGLAGATSAGDGICCGSRNELLPRFRDLVPGDDLYFGFSTYLASGFPTSGGWQVITQFKHNFDGSPPLSLNVEDGQFSIQGGYGHPSGPRHFVRSVGPAVTGQWSDWVLHVKFSPDPAVGFVEVWRDGELVLERFAPESGTMYPNPHGEVGSILKVGPYRESSIATPETIYFDNWRIGTTLNAIY